MEPVRKANYIEELKKRSKGNRITRPFQLVGLEIATALKDFKHKSLYIKFAKEYNPEKLLALAKDVASRRDVKNAGAYFMKVVKNLQIPSRKSQGKT